MKHLTEDERSTLFASLLIMETKLIQFPIDRHSGPYLQANQNKAIREILNEIRTIKEILIK